jgi:hypothetical protein
VVFFYAKRYYHDDVARLEREEQEQNCLASGAEVAEIEAQQQKTVNTVEVRA